MLAGLLVYVIGFESWSRWLTVTPLDEVLALSPAGRIDRDVQIRRDCRHSIELELSNGTRSREEADRLIRHRHPNGGVEVPVKWSLADSSGQVVSSGERKTAEPYAFGNGYIRREVAPARPLPHGRYRLSAAVLRDVPELDGISARLLFDCFDRKVSSGWQDDLLFFGSLIEWCLVLPLAALLAVILFGSATSHLPGRRKRDPP